MPTGIWQTVYKAAPSQKHNVSLEGTSGKTQYRLSFGYDSKENMMRYNPEKLSRYMANANISTEITKWLKAGTRISFTQRVYTEPNTPNNTLQYAMRWSPFISNWGTMVDPSTGQERYYRNTLSERLLAPTDKYTTRQTRLQAWMQAEIIKGLTLQADFTYDVNSYKQQASWIVQETWDWGSVPFAVYTWPGTGAAGTLVRARKNDFDRWTTNVFATYAKTFAQDHNMKIMAGFSAERYTYDNLYAQHKGRYDMLLPDLDLTYGPRPRITPSPAEQATAPQPVSSAVPIMTTKAVILQKPTSAMTVLHVSPRTSSGRSSPLSLQAGVSPKKTSSNPSTHGGATVNSALRTVISATKTLVPMSSCRSSLPATRM